MQHRKRHHLFCCSFVWGAVRKETSMRVFYFLSCVVFVVEGVFSDEKDGVKTVSKTSGTDVHLDTHLIGLQKDDLIEWTFGPQNISIAKTDGKSQNKIYNYNDERFSNRLYLQIETGDLTIKKASSEHSGLYQLKIINNTFTIQKRFSVSVSGLSSDAVTLVVGGVLVALLVAAAVVICYQCIINSKLKKEIAQRRLSESNSGSGLMRRINSI